MKADHRFTKAPDREAIRGHQSSRIAKAATISPLSSLVAHQAKAKTAAKYKDYVVLQDYLE